MKKRILTRVLAIVLCGSMLTMTSCIGSFSLTNRLLGWNQHVGNKFVNELVFFAFWILPASNSGAAATPWPKATKSSRATTANTL